MRIITGYEIWKAIQETHPQKLEKEFGFTSQTKFVSLEDIANEIQQL